MCIQTTTTRPLGELGCYAVKFMAKYKWIWIYTFAGMYILVLASSINKSLQTPSIAHPPYMCHLPPQLTTRKRKSFARSCITAVARDEQFWLC